MCSLKFIEIKILVVKSVAQGNNKVIKMSKARIIFKLIFSLVCLTSPCCILGQEISDIEPIYSDSLSINKNSLESAPIVIGSDTLFYMKNTNGDYPAKLRAVDINKRLANLKENYNKLLDSFGIVSANNYNELKLNNSLLMIVTDSDATLEDMTLEELSRFRLNKIQVAFSDTPQLSTKEWVKRIGLFLLSLLILYGIIKLINLLFNKMNLRMMKIEKKFLSGRGNLLKYFIPGNSKNVFVFLVNILRLISIAIILFIGAPFLFSFFPLSQNLVQKFYQYIEEPVIYVFNGIVNFIPSLFFIIIITITARYIARVVRALTTDVELGKLKINNFHKDWARPTGKLLSLFIYALALVLIFPYLPGSGSTAFQGVSIFIGAIISFGSTSAIANIIAGVVITYMRPFQIGDRVKIDNIVGDVINKTILVTHLRTTKNEDVTIPNANILIGNIINYSSHETGSIILHTTITLGYDISWKIANKLLLEAANRTQFLINEPAPFVLQTSLDDFYVAYELNAHTKECKKIPAIYSDIHKNILDVFDEAGIEILSPGYMAGRDGSLTTVPSQINKDSKSSLSKLVDHLTGKNQPIIKRKN